MPNYGWHIRGGVSDIVSVYSTKKRYSNCAYAYKIHRVVYYLSTWYTRKELAARIGIFYAASVAASAFGGLLAFGVFHIQSAKMFSWSYLFILEGCLTILVAILGFFVLPKAPRQAFFLNEKEKEIAEQRILLDSVEYLENRFSWTEALYEFKSPHVYIRMLIMCSAGILVSSNGNFLAPIVSSLGYSTVKTNLVSTSIFFKFQQ